MMPSRRVVGSRVSGFSSRWLKVSTSPCQVSTGRRRRSSTGMPSGPGAFLLLSCWRAYVSSPKVIFGESGLPGALGSIAANKRRSSSRPSTPSSSASSSGEAPSPSVL
eukprot:Lithocolla_globosa_v1_NODE_1850_length_2298_cov_3.220241.p5 type:complete len:108 gc:universal NODE_1850_length_2298_cov_3.220241:1198-1521(+)